MAWILISALAGVTLNACDNSDEAATPTTSSTASQSSLVTLTEPDWWTPPAESVDLMYFGRSVVVGRVTGVQRPLNPSLRLYTIFAVEVESVWQGTGISEGQTIYVGQNGGTWEGTTYSEKSNSLFEVGARYVLGIAPFSGFGTDADFDGYYMFEPFSQFRVEGTQLQPKDAAWADLPAVAQLTGRSLEEARATVAAIVRSTPIPDETLVAAVQSIATPPGAEQGTIAPIVPDQGQAGSGYRTTMSPEDVIAFYEQELSSPSWTTETAVKLLSADKGGTDYRSETWTLTKGDLRVLVQLSLTPKAAPPGEIAVLVTVQPVWYSGLNSYIIPSICALPSSISNVRPTSSVCRSP